DPVAGEYARDASEARPSADRARHQRLVLDDQHPHAPMVEPARIVGISKTTYVLATPRWLEWRRALQRTGTNTDPSHYWDPRRRPAGRPRGDRRGPRPPVAGVLVLEGRTIHRRPSR